MTCKHNWVYVDKVKRIESNFPFPLDMIFDRVTARGVLLICTICAEEKIVWKRTELEVNRK